MTTEQVLSTSQHRPLKEKLRNPHVLAELVKLSLNQSSEAQKDFLHVLEKAASSIREMLDKQGLIKRIQKNHAEVWSSVAGKPICFIDGGMANLSSLGAEPVAVRVGSYTVIPGEVSDEREKFRMEKQLVAELFDATSEPRVFEHAFEDPSKMRDAARISLETAAAVAALTREPRPEFLFMHGALVNPVSAYADSKFPPFSKRGLELLGASRDPDWPDMGERFVVVYLRLLQKLRSAGVNVVSVVERASFSSLVVRTVLEELKFTDVSPGPSEIKKLEDKLASFSISDAVLFQVLFENGEYLEPVAVDRNSEERRPPFSAHIIEHYPKPYVTYIAVGAASQPIRVEFFGPPPAGYEACLRLVYHACQLMPNYAFPVGLDIVDKFAKVPNWMNRPIHSSMAVQMMKRALDSGNPQIIAAAKQMLCGTKRDWLFRPDFNR
jgi:hypothetical protein